jgi:two-component sensor histidine kinase
MKGAATLKKIAFSSWFLASIPTIIIFLFLPHVGSKFSLVSETALNFGSDIIFEDLNSDSISETVQIGKSQPFYYVAFRNLDYRIYDQWNLPETLNPNISEPIFGNYDHDRFREIYIFSHNKDSLFLNYNEALEPSGIRKERIFITNVGYVKGEVTSMLYPCGFYDENGDGKDEIYFGISTGFGIQPRKVFYFDIANNKIYSSQFTGAICLFPRMKDPDGDKKPEIFGLMTASGNYKTKVPYTDNSVWLMVFNEKLNFEFSPVEFPGFANGLEVNSFEIAGHSGYIASLWAGGADTTVPGSRIMIYSTDGELLRYRLYSEIGKARYIQLFVTKHKQSDKIYILENKFIELNEKLEVVREVELPFNTFFFVNQADINLDGEEEFILYSEDESKLAIYDAGLHKLSENTLSTSGNNWKISHYYSNDHEHKLYVRVGDKGYFLKLTKNKYYYFSYLMFPGIYFLVFFFILLVRKITTYQVVQRESYKNRLLTLQLQAIKSQLDPHFTFNALNSIASLIYLKDRKVAYDYMNKFTHLLRAMLNDADRIYRSLGEEIEFVRTYLDLEKLRFGEKFNYRIEMDETVSLKIQVPKMVIQTFAENAIKHGIMPCIEGGLLIIKVGMENESLKITIEDNGIGRAKSAGRSVSTGKGLKLTGEFYQILNQMTERPIKHVLTDLYDEMGAAGGTKVEVWVPVEER